MRRSNPTRDFVLVTDADLQRCVTRRGIYLSYLSTAAAKARCCTDSSTAKCCLCLLFAPTAFLKTVTGKVHWISPMLNRRSAALNRTYFESRANGACFLRVYLDLLCRAKLRSTYTCLPRATSTQRRVRLLRSCVPLPGRRRQKPLDATKPELQPPRLWRYLRCPRTFLQ